MKDNSFNEWKKRNKITHKEASNLLHLSESTLYSNASQNSFGKKTVQLMELIDTIREKDEEIDNLKSKIVALASC